MFIKNNDGSVDRIIAISNDNRNIMIGKEYKLVNTLNDIKQERKLSNIVAFISIIINILLFVYIFV